jgi:hypothetical protein
MAFIGTLVFLYAAIGTTFKSKIAIDQGLLQNQLPVSVKIFEDYYYGPFPSSGNQYLDLIYTDFRYRVIGNAMKRYYSDKNTTVTDPLSKPFRSLNMQGHRSLCAFMSMPFVFRSLSTDVSGESNTFNDYVLL